jgi:hypothetical protein
MSQEEAGDWNERRSCEALLLQGEARW